MVKKDHTDYIRADLVQNTQIKFRTNEDMIVVKYARQQSNIGLRIDKIQTFLYHEVDRGNFYYYGFCRLLYILSIT